MAEQTTESDHIEAHPFDAYDGASVRTCTRMVIEDGDGVECGLPPDHPIHRTRVEGHDFLPVAGHPDDDECTHREGGTDATYCGQPRAWHDHHPRCYQNTGVPDDLPPDLCDCRVLRMIEQVSPPATRCDGHVSLREWGACPICNPPGEKR